MLLPSLPPGGMVPENEHLPCYQHSGLIMITPEILAMTYGLGSALAWGAGDFSGGFASRKSSALLVVFISQIVGALLLYLLMVMTRSGPPALQQVVWGGLAGVFGVMGLVALYTALARGTMGVVAPLSAVVTALVPVIVAFFTEGLPGYSQILGFGSALLAVWLFCVNEATAAPSNKNAIVLSVLAGFGFSLFFICIDRISSEAILWPLLSARLTSVAIIGSLLVWRRQVALPPARQLPYIILAGIFDITGNGLFALASKLGRLDVAAVLASLYPASTVLLARCLLKEKLARSQRFGFMAACVALVLIAT